MIHRFISYIAVLFIAVGYLLADNLVRQETGVDDVHSMLGITGNDVIIAILDRGIDYEHPDFINPDGTSRILYIYDMLDDPGNGEIGIVYSKAEIDAALISGQRLATRDAVGHGTATAGLAGGNGVASGGQYAGMAPDAKFIIVKITSEGAPAHGNEAAEAAFYDPTYIPIAIDFVLEKAAEEGLPVVMLANFGSINGPMDGTSSLARAIDTRFGESFPGRVFITGSSDDGGTDNHAAGTISSGQSIDLQINVVNNFARVDLWYDETDRFDVEIITPTGSLGPYVAPATSAGADFQSTSTVFYFHRGSDVDFSDADNGRREILIDIVNAPGIYTLRLTGATVVDGSFQASLNPATILGATTNEFQSFVVPGHTIWDLAAAFNNITPNSYVFRENWTDVDGISRTFPGNDAGEGALWTGSGVGPTFDGRLGITVSAPGNSNIAAYGERSYFNTFRFNVIDDQNGPYGVLGAVSGAAPVLTGIVALMLSVDSTLNAIEVRDILQNTARSDVFTGTTPNTSWGYGKVDALAAVTEVMNLSDIEGPNDPLASGFELMQNYPNPFNPATTIAYEIGQPGPVQLIIYDTAGRTIRTLANESLQPAGRYEVLWDGRDQAGQNVGSGIYFYRLQAGDYSLVNKAILLR